MRLLVMNRVGARSKEEKEEEAAAAVGYDALRRSASIQSSMPSCGKFQERFPDNFVSFAASTYDNEIKKQSLEVQVCKTFLFLLLLRHRL